MEFEDERAARRDARTVAIVRLVLLACVVAFLPPFLVTVAGWVFGFGGPRRGDVRTAVLVLSLVGAAVLGGFRIVAMRREGL
ncbi:hypothetical protein GCM10009836_62850 [Pseudonocardia ailaonensis]|uniref:Uncharacterized protein n=1 Tax=Pseudonocardia ailaonensis TaxID=367279 RepID=A0ABN2NL24_9PSEU